MLLVERFKSHRWRLFSQSHPPPGVVAWNAAPTWKAAWGLPEESLWAFGEDIFGNQLVVLAGSTATTLWGHEAGDLFDLHLSPIELLATVLDHGVDWVDYYIEGTLAVARARLASVPADSHLHWTTPLILGGQVSEANTSIVERGTHLNGHAALWKQLFPLDPGTVVIAKPR